MLTQDRSRYLGSEKTFKKSGILEVLMILTSFPRPVAQWTPTRTVNRWLPVRA